MARGQGRVFQRGGSKKWYIEYWWQGRQHRESSGSFRERDAVALLRRRLGQVDTGRLVGPQFERTTFEELTQMLVDDYQVNGRKSLDRAVRSIRHLRSFFGGCRAIEVTSDRVSSYIRFRLEATPPAKPATIQNELAALKRMFSLAYRAGKVAARPAFPGIKVRNTRSGFFEEEQFQAVLKRLPHDIRGIVEFTFLTGWRIGEVRTLQWRQVDFVASIVRLEPGTTKNDEGRVFPFGAAPDLCALLQRQRQLTSVVEQEQGRLVPWVFHRRGKPVRTFHDAWRRACREAGCPARLVHDLRRTAVREMERAGVSRSVAMKLTGHKTESIYRRYAIVSEADLAEGVGRRAAFRSNSRPVPAQFGATRGTAEDESTA
ncbi:MAG: site-specific integrase [Candidatus Eisenbacteria bacterium]|uniref:Site-specific integrase n=1 Tax=Eiseniibacteriota bacterium TaxID=2212470 RepID=A0A849SHR0_UNCEI|nr:site-specific integrase [Candidatus Eisenbacteria bacterium]